ncbi:MAG: peptidylprolyl isomerase [Eubacterium sp.]|nr:peptidylprolyl isomerase [Eubacterium sp.]MDD7208688.1 peptidylprolyl isomerase [Lachnospiraceae bacterium]MDY5497131.1 peptidylprolyl isomerase [Anaerobutyricum sp.]
MSEKIIAVAAGKEITETEFNEFISHLAPEQQNYAGTPEGRKQALTQYCNYFLFEKLGEEKKYDEEESFLKIMDNVKREVLSQYALTRELSDIVATREECKSYFDKNKTMFQKDAKAHAKHILTETEEESLKALKEIESGEKTFEDAAKEYSACPSKVRGGDLGTFGRGQMVKEFDEAVFNAEIGKLIGPVKTDFGYHLICVEELSGEGQASFEEVLPQIMQQLSAEKQNKRYMELRTSLAEKYGLEFKE